MEMTVIPTAPPIAEPQAALSNSPNGTSPKESFHEVFDQTCQNEQGETSHIATGAKGKNPFKTETMSLTEPTTESVELTAADLAGLFPEPLRMSSADETKELSGEETVFIINPLTGQETTAAFAPSPEADLCSEAQGATAADPLAASRVPRQAQQPAAQDSIDSKETADADRQLQESASPSVVKGDQRDPAGLTESTLGGMIRDSRPAAPEVRQRWNGESLRGDALTGKTAKPSAIPADAGLDQEGSFEALLAEQSNTPLAASDRSGSRQIGGSTVQTSFDTLVETGQHNPVGSPATEKPLPEALAPATVLFTAEGNPVTENQVVNQVLERLSLERAGEQSRIVIRLHPEELGEVKLSLVLEKDQLRAQLLTRNTQVQEVLEKHLPKLHEALDKQGLKLEDIQVEVDSGRNPGQESFADRRQTDGFRRVFGEPFVELNNGPLPTAAASRQTLPTAGLSLRI